MAWEQVCDQYGAEEIAHYLCEYESRLYCSTYPSGLLLRLNIERTAWELVCDTYSGATNIASLCVFDDRLYGVDFGGTLLALNESSDSWELVATPTVDECLSLTVFDGEMYAAGYLSSLVKGRLIKLNSTKNAWVDVATTPVMEYLKPLCVHDGNLYGATYAAGVNGGILYKLNSGKDGFDVVAPQYDNYTAILSLISFNGNIYAGTFATGGGSGGAILTLNESGNQWEVACARHEDDTRIQALKVLDDELYAGGAGTLLKANLGTGFFTLVNDVAYDQSYIGCLETFFGVLYASTASNCMLFKGAGTHTEPTAPPVPVSITPIFPYLPDWRGQISVSYKFTTAISTTRREREQRSSMYFKPRRLISCMFTLRKNQASKLWNFLVRIRSTVFLFPIISEPIISTERDSVEFTSPDLYPLNALTDYHNINRVDVSAAEHSAVLLYDLRDSILPEGAIITDIITRALPANPDGAKIETNGWTGAFTRGHTNIYPGVPVMLTSKQKKNITDSTCQISITVDEIPGFDVT